MLDIFFTDDLRALLENKYIVFMGDSNIRAQYKDFLCLLTCNQLISERKLRMKMENSIFGDKLKSQGVRTNGRTYREEREFENFNVRASFYFLTRVYDEYTKIVLKEITSKRKPDILIVNSCLWDVTRWGATGVTEYKLNLTHFLKQLQLQLPHCLVIWMTTPPISQEVKGGFLVKELQFLKYSLRFHVVEANHFARKVVVQHGFDVLDVHYHLKLQIHRRTKDGIHWPPPAVRYISNLFFTHISLAWNVPLPHRYESPIMAENLEKLDDEVNTEVPVQETKVQVQEMEQDRSPVKVQSIVVKPDKENCDTPKSNKRKRSPRAKKPYRGASHHTYFNRTQRKKRTNRIRQWKTKDISNYSQNHSYQSPSDSQHDSGYFHSPNEAYLSNDSLHSSQRNYSYSSPQCSRTVDYKNNSSPWRPSLPRETYYTDLPPLPSEPYPYSPKPQFRIGRSVLQNPYVFPHVQQGQILHPRIDFTSNDFEAY